MALVATWPESWPEEARAHYERLAQQWHWSPSAVEGVISNVEYLRSLHVSDRPRRYYAHETDGWRFLYEAVEDRGELVAIRQIDTTPDGIAHHYWWGRREDGDGFLTDQPLGRSPVLQPLTAA